VPAYSQEAEKSRWKKPRSGMVLLKNEGIFCRSRQPKIKTIVFLVRTRIPLSLAAAQLPDKAVQLVSYMEGISNYLGENARVLYSVETAPLEPLPIRRNL